MIRNVRPDDLEGLRQFKAEFFKALAHPLRIRLLELLRDGPLSVGQLQEAVGVPASSISQQLAVLRGRNIVVTARRGTMVIYRVRDPELAVSRTRARLDILLTARAGRDRIDGVGNDGVLRVRVAAPAVDEAANRALVELIAEVLELAPSSVRIVAGQHARRKSMTIDGLADADLAERWPGLGRR